MHSEARGPEEGPRASQFPGAAGREGYAERPFQGEKVGSMPSFSIFE